MANHILPRQWKFINGVCAGKTQKAAAIEAGYPAGRAQKTGNRLMHNPKIRAEIAKTREKIREVTLYDAQAAVTELDDAIKFARESDNATAVMRGIELKAKLHGLLVDKVDQRISGGGFSINISGIGAPKEKVIEGEAVQCLPSAP